MIIEEDLLKYWFIFMLRLLGIKLYTESYKEYASTMTASPLLSFELYIELSSFPCSEKLY